MGITITNRRAPQDRAKTAGTVGIRRRLRRIAAGTTIAAATAMSVGDAPHSASAASVNTYCNSVTNELQVALSTNQLPGASLFAYAYNIGDANQWAGWDGWYYLSTNNLINHRVGLPDGGVFYAKFQFRAYYPATGTWSQPQSLGTFTCRT